MTTADTPNSASLDRQWPNVTLATVLNSREDLLVEYAAAMEVAIDRLRDAFGALPRQMRLRNAEKSVAPSQKGDAYISYVEWLRKVADKLDVKNIGDLAARLASFRPNKIVGNIDGARPRQYTYGSFAKDRDPWREVRVSTVQAVLDRVNDAVTAAQRRFGRRPHGDVWEYVENRVLASRRGGADTKEALVRPVARVVAVAMSTKPEYVRLQTKTWTDQEHGGPLASRSSQGPQLGKSLGPGGQRQSHNRGRESVRQNNWDMVFEYISRTVEEGKSRGIPILIAINAPLGWPMAMTEASVAHEAGAPLPRLDIGTENVDMETSTELSRGYHEMEHESRWRQERNRFFRRETEQIVREESGVSWGPFGPSGLDVGSDKSARTMHQALRLLKAVRKRTGLKIPVVTDECGPITHTSAIEVYTSWPRTPADDLPRKVIIDAEDDPQEESVVPNVRSMPDDRWTHNASTGVREAIAFLEHNVRCPHDCRVPDEIARKEGWIWFSQCHREER